MLPAILQKIKKVVYGILILLGIGGGSLALGSLSGAADFRTSLASQISATATAMTLVSTSTASGEYLIQGNTYGFKIGGREYVIGTLSSGKQITSLTRGVSLITGTSTGGIAEAWGRGTAVEITDAPVLLEIANKITGTQNLDVPLRYSSAVTTSTLETNFQNVASVNYVIGRAFSGAGAIAASESGAGYSELANQIEQASSTVSGSAGPLTLQAQYATSTYNRVTAGLRLLVTQNNGWLDPGFLQPTTTKSFQFNATTYVASSSQFVTGIPLLSIGKNMQIFTAMGTTSFSVPSGITKVWVKMVGGGGGGGGSNASAASCGGGGGAYSEGPVDITGTTTIQVHVGENGTGGTNGPTAGAKGNWSTFGTDGFYMSALGGSGGGVNICSAPGAGGATTTATAYLNIPGGDGRASISTDPSGGSSAFGGPNLNGGTPTIFGSGGSGRNNSGNGTSGGTGLVVITW